MKYKGIIFDLDGTLLDTLEDITEAANHALAKHGYASFTPEEYKIKLGNGFKHLIVQSLQEDASDEDLNGLLISFSDYYMKNYLNKTKPYEGVDEMLDELICMGIKIGVNSNKRNDFVLKLVDKYFARIPFVGVFGERQGLPKKPDPYTAHELVNLMGFGYDEILYIGDSNTDIITAINANLDSIGVLWGFRGYDELKQTGAKYIVSKPKEIVNLIRNS